MKEFVVGERVRVVPFEEIELSLEEKTFVYLSKDYCFGIPRKSVDDLCIRDDIVISDVDHRDGTHTFYSLCTESGRNLSWTWIPGMLESREPVCEPVTEVESEKLFGFLLG